MEQIEAEATGDRNLPTVAMGDFTLKDVEYSFLQKGTSLKNCRCIMDWALIEVRKDRIESEEDGRLKGNKVHTHLPFLIRLFIWLLTLEL